MNGRNGSIFLLLLELFFLGTFLEKTVSPKERRDSLGGHISTLSFCAIFSPFFGRHDM